MPKRGVLSSRLESLQGPFDGREGGVPENVESDAALRAKSLRTRQIYARAQAKGYRCVQSVSLEVTMWTCQMVRVLARSAAAWNLAHAKIAENHRVQLPTRSLQT